MSKAATEARPLVHYCTTKNKYIKHFPKMQRNVGKAVPNTTETRCSDGKTGHTMTTQDSIPTFFMYAWHPPSDYAIALPGTALCSEE